MEMAAQMPGVFHPCSVKMVLLNPVAPYYCHKSTQNYQCESWRKHKQENVLTNWRLGFINAGRFSGENGSLQFFVYTIQGNIFSLLFHIYNSKWKWASIPQLTDKCSLHINCKPVLKQNSETRCFRYVRRVNPLGQGSGPESYAFYIWPMGQIQL